MDGEKKVLHHIWNPFPSHVFNKFRNIVWLNILLYGHQNYAHQIQVIRRASHHIQVTISFSLSLSLSLYSLYHSRRKQTSKAFCLLIFLVDCLSICCHNMQHFHNYALGLILWLIALNLQRKRRIETTSALDNY